MIVVIDTNLILDGIYLVESEKIPQAVEYSVELFRYIKEENNKKHEFFLFLQSILELPKTISDSYI